MLVEEHVELAPLTTFRVGGPARFYTRASTEADVLDALSWARRSSIPSFVLGGGSNLVVADAGLEALVVHLTGMRGFSRRDGLVRVASGEPWDDVVARCVN